MHSGTLDPIVGSRQIVALIQGLDDEVRNAEHFAPFLFFESETEDFPRGAERVAWSKDSLRRKDTEAEEYIERYSPTLEKACLDLISVFGPVN